MPTVEQLLQKTLDELTSLCEKVAADSSTDTNTKKEALNLRKQYFALVAKQSPLPLTFAERKRIDSKKKVLKRKMAELLVQTAEALT